ncbi:hypothetical protein QMG61_03610 [Cryobacterium sp. PH31-AA6]|uniref:hypothetical protein n=1 Tax=Cryobacterium sp. PH31-AA6 TaxID=3046205 RepID=UPI0024B8F552|nr:hypothetical protein [Cryobacterium sp. PH31-AA6]MDJ0322852.1 hypothetical protein [Cryobacterium sp. PH31-AA6]
MTESELVNLWIKTRWHVIVSQVAPTLLLTALVGFLALGLATADLSVRVAAAGVLLASGILGALVQINAANEALAVIADLRDAGGTSAVTRRILSAAPWVNVVRFVTPAVFVVVYVALLVALFSG